MDSFVNFSSFQYFLDEPIKLTVLGTQYETGHY